MKVCDSPEALEVKVKELAALLSSANHVVAYTGAGISTWPLDALDHIRVSAEQGRIAFHQRGWQGREGGIRGMKKE